MKRVIKVLQKEIATKNGFLKYFKKELTEEQIKRLKKEKKDFEDAIKIISDSLKK